MKDLILSLFFMFCIPSLVYSARPLSVDDAGTVDLGICETEVGIGYEQDRKENGEFELSLTIKHGLTERMDIGENKSDSPIEGLIGANFSARENLTLDFGIGTGVNDYGSRLNLTGGLTFSF